MPITLNAVTVGLASVSLNAAPGSLRKVTFGGKETITVPAGAPVLSDAIALEVGDSADLVVSVYLNDGTTVFDCGSDAAPSDQAVIDGSDVTLAERFSAGRLNWNMASSFCHFMAARCIWDATPLTCSEILRR